MLSFHFSSKYVCSLQVEVREYRLGPIARTSAYSSEGDSSKLVRGHERNCKKRQAKLVSSEENAAAAGNRNRIGATGQALHTLHATTEGKKDLNPSQPNTAHRVSESFFALSMSVTLNGNSTVHSASAEFQTNSVIHPSPNQPSGRSEQNLEKLFKRKKGRE
ncbi:hypothetical protein VNO80_17155 [Phaseolus coccineus]|uniref:Uncharacterized protein n=1 Tax=Phaseolus coccineus TaxID=3886 RepID=A0AAN9R8M2_PHACN